MKEAVCPTDKTKNDTEAKAFQTFLVTATGFTAAELPDIDLNCGDAAITAAMGAIKTVATAAAAFTALASLM
jgi:DNA polymerase III alpha subunit (gram-positive type)